MAFQGIVTGFTPNDGQGDTLLAGAIKTNDNFRELYEALGDGTSIGIATLTQLKLSGILTATSLDVPNINLSGILTAATLTAANVQVSGAVTANSFSGDLNGNVVATSFNSLGSLSVGNQVRITSAGALQNIVSAATSSLTVTGDSTLSNVTAGVVTATEFNGNFNGTFTGNSIGLSGSPDIEVGIVTANTGVGIGTSVTNTWLSFPTGSSISGSDIIRAGSSALDYTLYALKSDDQHVIRHVTTGNYTVSVASTNQFAVSNSDGWGLLGSVHPGGVQDSDTAFVVRPDTSTELRYNYDKKFETTGYGVSVTGGINVSGVSTLTGQVSFGNTAIFGDDDKILMGDGQDLEIFHASNNSYIRQAGTGHLYIRNLADDRSIYLQSDDGTGGYTTYLQANGASGNVQLFHYGSQRFATRDYGIEVTGHTETDTLNVSGVATAAGFVGPLTGDATGLSGSPSITVTNITASGNVSIAGTLTYEDVTNIDAIGLITARSGVQVDSGGIDVTGVSTFSSDVNIGTAATTVDLPALRLKGNSAEQNFITNPSISIGGTAAGKWYDTFLVDGPNLQYVRHWANGFHINFSVPDDRTFVVSNTDGASSVSPAGVVDGHIAFKINPQTSTELRYNKVKKFETTGVGVTVFGTTESQELSVSGVSTFQGNVNLGDDDRLRLGDGNDLQIFHNASHSFIQQTGVGNLYISNNVDDQDVIISTDDGLGGTTSYFRADGSTGEARLYHYGNQKLATKPGGIEIGGLTDTHDLKVAGIATLGSHTLDSNDFKVGTSLNFKSSDGSTNILTLNQSGSVDLYHNTNKKFETTASGVEVTGGLVADNLSVSGVSTLTGLTRHVGVASFFDDVNFLFDDGTGKVTLGPNKELEIFHANATGNSVIKESGSGSLILAGDNVVIRNSANNENKASFISDGAANLFFNNGKKFETTGVGASVLGTLEATSITSPSAGIGSLSVSGNSNITGILTASEYRFPNYGNGNLTRLSSGQLVVSGVNDKGSVQVGVLTTVFSMGQAPFNDNCYFSQSSERDWVFWSGLTTTSMTVNGGISTRPHSVTLRKLYVDTDADIAGNLNVSGVVTATSFSGSGSALTGLTGASAGSYGSGSAIPVITVDANGRITGISTASNAGGGGGGGLANVVDDTAPQLGGSLNATGFNIEFGDSAGSTDDRLTFGVDNDLQIYHDSNNSIIEDTGTGFLGIRGESLIALQSLNGSENYAIFNKDGAVELYHNNSQKFRTLSTGATITGNLSATSFSGDGSNLTGIVTSLVAGSNVTLGVSGGRVTINASGGAGGAGGGTGINVQNNGVAIGSTTTQTINFNNDLEATVNGSVVTVNSTAPSQATAIALAIALG
jgi:hypothetical protein